MAIEQVREEALAGKRKKEAHMKVTAATSRQKSLVLFQLVIFFDEFYYIFPFIYSHLIFNISIDFHLQKGA